VFAVPEHATIPVSGATSRDWNKQSFWYSPCGASGVHKGIDIFAPRGREVLSPVPGVVVYKGTLGRGGNVVAVLGPRWRLHYFAHLDSAQTHAFALVSRGALLGRVGNSGNAVGKPAHLHYAVLALVPRPWLMSRDPQGWKRMFFVDPNTLFDAAYAAPSTL
jgi:murein DD-endopeptidase MepM/ murein hydrolase activator NlpD